jgi:hypothetical protein
MGGIMPSLAHSPDEADGAALCLQSAIIHYGFRIGQKREIITQQSSFADAKLNAFKAELAQKKEARNQLAIGSGFGNAVTDFRRIPLSLNSALISLIFFWDTLLKTVVGMNNQWVLVKEQPMHSCRL